MNKFGRRKKYVPNTFKFMWTNYRWEIADAGDNKLVPHLMNRRHGEEQTYLKDVNFQKGFLGSYVLKNQC